MKYEAPKSLKKINKFLIKCEWPDGFSSTIKLEKLRAGCPCADCNKEEETGIGNLNIPMMSTFKEGMNDLVKLQAVGNYAVTALWGDGHDTGIYTWDTLRSIFEENMLSDEEIEKLK